MDAAAVFKISSLELPEASRSEMLREYFCQGVLNLDFTPANGDPLFIEAEMRALPGMVLTYGTCAGHVARSRDMSRESDDFLIVWGERGGRLQQRQHETESGSAFTLLTCAERVTAMAWCLMHHRTIKLSRSMLLAVLPSAEQKLSLPLPIQSEAFQLLDAYLTTLQGTGALHSPELAHSAALHICDLAALALGADGEGEELAASRGLRAGRLLAVKRWIFERLSDPHLSVQGAAARFGVTGRAIQMLFETEGTTFTSFVLAQGLSLAVRRLGDPLHSGRAISAIAFECGFSDLSYFNRAFRSALGATPSEIRHLASRSTADYASLSDN